MPKFRNYKNKAKNPLGKKRKRKMDAEDVMEKKQKKLDKKARQEAKGRKRILAKGTAANGALRSARMQAAAAAEAASRATHAAVREALTAPSEGPEDGPGDFDKLLMSLGVDADRLSSDEEESLLEEDTQEVEEDTFENEGEVESEEISEEPAGEAGEIADGDAPDETIAVADDEEDGGSEAGSDADEGGSDAIGYASYNLQEIPRVEDDSMDATLRLTEQLDRCKVHGSRAMVERVEASEGFADLLPKIERSFKEHGCYNESLSSEGLALASALSSYSDVVYGGMNYETERETRKVAMAHVMAHVVRARNTVWKNNEKLRRHALLGEKTEEFDTDPYRDQGFSRPRVLILCPFRNVAREYVQWLLKLAPNNQQTMNRKRFDEQFGNEEFSSQAEATSWREGIFPEDDFNDDDFRVGIQVGRRMVRLYAPFSASDIIIASPLGLRLITGAEGDTKREFDFLSSIEMVVLDRADILSMQNWDHVLEILKVTNVQPSTLPDGADISRLRPWIADGLARRFRQTVVLTDVYNPVMESVVHDSWSEGAEGNWRGWVRMLPSTKRGTVAKCSINLGIAKQMFMHVAVDDPAEASDKFLKFFEERYWRDIGSGLGRLAICVSSYFEYLRLRAFLKKNDASFVAIDEYSSNKSMGRARQFFLTQQKKVILISGRLLWYRKLRIKGIQHYLFYGVPERPEIYEDLLRDVRVPSQCYSTCLYSSCDGYELERLVGRERLPKLLTAPPGKVTAFT
ncbi:hypothetical protein FOL47_000942 [Perkinsus chesapeaki]|uniref:U3 small nucleolar RNA-associated protein 25 n=1 Tax=Perkinsus chesapeaki TaxID=330153 RepID=A0A7J6N1P0_PERCH|nr:hypothetical protein FOL47_000942 [Perkinsus chesapeaki]